MITRVSTRTFVIHVGSKRKEEIEIASNDELLQGYDMKGLLPPIWSRLHDLSSPWRTKGKAKELQS